MNLANNAIDIPYHFLSEYDDIMTDCLLDSLYLGFRINKMNPAYQPRPEQHCPSDIVNIIRKLVMDRDLNDATNSLLDLFLPPVPNKNTKMSKKVRAALKKWTAIRYILIDKDEDQLYWFAEHAKRYLGLYMPSAGYEVARTSRYHSDVKPEACLIAAKKWDVGEQISLCTGYIAALTEEQEESMSQDFSVMFSARKNCSCLFLGPARLINHDCRPNCEFISIGQNAISFRVARPIEIGEELTVFYGANYFGEDNSECRCVTCEKRGIGHFAVETNLPKNPDSINELSSKRSRSIDLKYGYNVKKLFREQLSNKENAIININRKSNLKDGVTDTTCETCSKTENRLIQCGLLVKIYYYGDFDETLCELCYRHKKIFGCDRPERTIVDDESEYDEHTFSYPIPDAALWKNMSNAEKVEYVSKNMGGVIPDITVAPGTMVLVDPEKIRSKIWWAAQVITYDDVPDSVRPRLIPDAVPVRYFADGSYEACPPSALRIFDVHDEPYTSLQAICTNIERDQGIANALQFLENGSLPKCWNDN